MAPTSQTITWAITWDCNGLESLINLTQLENEETFQRLQEGSATDQVARILRMLQLRARMNSQRNYEIWVIDASEEITEAVLESGFNDNPEGFKHLVRIKGIKQFH